MFETVFDAIQGFHQAGFLVVAAILLGIALAIFGDFVRWRMLAREYTGEIVALRARKIHKKEGSRTPQRSYFPVIEYRDNSGQRIRARTYSGGSNLGDQLPGKGVRILVMQGEPDVARIKGMAHVIFASVLAGMGSVCLLIALVEYRSSIWTVACILAMLAVGGFKILASASGRAAGRRGAGGPSSLSEWKKRSKAARLEDCEEIDAVEAHRISAQQDRAARKAAPFFAAISVALVGGGFYLGQEVLALETTGLSAIGEVVRVESKQSRDSDGKTTTMYSPVIRFVSRDGRQIEYESKVSSSSSRYRRGDAVDMLYSASDPERDVMIDRGVMNWLLPGAMTGVGVLVFCVSLRSFFAARRRDRRRRELSRESAGSRSSAIAQSSS